ncbi:MULTISPECIES: AAA family ATPase [Sorangium]|uniref:Serine/threonine protein kinase n=1 Tax=Sorangium cellulosum TaxID=56 RepID=A0A4P2R5F9_SORCE|nr:MULTISPECIES: AAA family ATPase [Sorangium]AUX38008.1 serine/threonine protein kinase [Sorangium cellulosum]WCQ97296.1 serine-threonine kinase [Sorangium sp. Soce836]
MVELLNHELLDTLHDGARSSVYLGRKKSTGKMCVIKVARKGVNGTRNVAILKRQYEITRNLDLDGVVKVYDLEVRLDYAALIMEYFAGRSLRSVIDEGIAGGGNGRGIGLARSVRIALQLADTLGAIHERNIIHKDIKPSNIIVDSDVSTSKLTDFSIASLLPGERAAVYDPWSAGEGTLQYISPEQTGRMNRSIDFRSDYYSLGVTLYELTTRRLPFETTDPLELVHHHIAKTPVAPHLIRPEIPEALSRVIMKLLSKTAEERYQSIFGLKADLKACLHMLEHDAPALDFVPGRKDKPTRLQISQRLYGRQEEVGALLSAFRSISGAGGPSELVLVAGYSGVGKSAVVSEIHKPIAKQGGYFAAGKFDQFTRNVPYAAVIAALREIVRQILTESKEELADWKARILAAVAPNGRVIAEVIPEIELILGEQPPVPALGSMETRNRFNLTFRSFIGAIAQKTRALVLFLDDLQWADTGSLNLISVLLEDADIRHLLLLGSYRDNETDDAHPLRVMLGALPRSGARVRTIALKPLAPEHVNQLVSDTLDAPPGECRPLSDIIFAKTHGNPFFTIQYLESVCRDGHLRFSSETGAWTWNIADIERMDVADNVVDLMVRRIQGLRAATQQVLKLAACVGNQFDLRILALLHHKDLRATDEDLWDALDAGLVVPVDGDYKIARFLDDDDDEGPVTFKFLHDRVQQAAYKLLTEVEQERTHLELGRLLIRETPIESIEERIYDIVMHLNMGAELIVDRRERFETALLNLKAGQKARRSTAYGPGVQCLRAAAAFLPEDAWEANHDLSLAIYTDLVELEYLTINFDRAEASAKIVEERARDVLETIRVYETRIQFYISQNRMHEAIELGLRVLTMLEVPLSEAPPANVDIARLAQLPPMKDRRMQAAMRILASVNPAAYLARPALVPTLAFTMVDICVRHGNSPLGAFGYTIYGLIQCGFMNNIDLGFEFGRLGIELVRRFGAVEIESKVYALNYMVLHHWKRHARETIEPLRHGIQVGLDTGDIEYAGYNSIHHATYPLFIGEELASVEQRMKHSVDLSLKLDQQYQLYYVRIWRQLVRSLRDPSASKRLLAGESFDETTMMSCLGHNRPSMFSLHLAKGMQLYFFNYPKNALSCLRAGGEYQDGAAGFITLVEHNFYQSLSALAAFDEVSKEERSAVLAGVEASQLRLGAWARSAPQNSQHKYDLVQAELARVKHAVVEAMDLYDRAIQGARKHGYMHEEALGCELASSFYRRLGRHEIAQHYLTMAYRGYALWGADAKCQSLVATFPQLLLEGTAEQPMSVTTTSSHDGAILDLLSVIRASQALASEIVLEKLLGSLMTLVLESVGAQSGVLALARGGSLFVEAEGTVEPQQVNVLQGVAMESFRRAPQSIVSYVQRTLKSVLLDNAADEAKFSADPYIRDGQIKSLMCLPILRQGRLVGVLYVENNLSTGAFTKARFELLSLLSTQVAISIENAKLYERLEQEVATRTEELRVSNEQLRTVNDRLQLELAERVRLQEERVQMQEEIIQTQRERLFELSTPCIPITDEIMVMPIIGTIDDKRAAQMIETAMESVASSSAKVVIVDITGVKSLDTSVASRLMSLARALGLLGSKAILTGLRPAVAQSLVALGVDLGTIETRANLKAGIAYAMRRTSSRLYA